MYRYETVLHTTTGQRQSTHLNPAKSDELLD